MASSKEVKETYTSTLRDLTCNNKPLIHVLTMLAEESVANAKDIAEAIDEHLAKVAPEVKLPVLYLVDCIIKNVGGPYTAAFCNNIVNMFCSTFQVVDEKIRKEMYKLRQTWNDVLPKSKLYALDVQTKQMDPAWPITAPPPTIHFNPRFLNNVVAKEDPLVTVADAATLDMQNKLIQKQKQLLELQQKKLELELLQTQVNLEKRLKTGVTNNATAPKNLLLKPEVAKQLQLDVLDSQKVIGKPNSAKHVTPPPPKLNNVLVPGGGGVPTSTGVKPIRDPRLLRAQSQPQHQNSVVNSFVQLENKSSASNVIPSDPSKVIVNSKGSGGTGGVAHASPPHHSLVNNNKDDTNQPPAPAKVKLSRIPLKSKQQQQSNNQSPTKNGQVGKASSSGSTSSLESPVKTKNRYKKSGKSRFESGGSASNSGNSKKGKKSPERPAKDSPPKDRKRDRNYRHRVTDRDDDDVDMRGSRDEIETSPRQDVDLRHLSGKRLSSEVTEEPAAKKTKSELIDKLFGSEDVDLRQTMSSTEPEPMQLDSPMTPPPPPIITVADTQETQPPKTNSPSSAAPSNLDFLRAKLAKATKQENLISDKTKDEDPEKIPNLMITKAEEADIIAGKLTDSTAGALFHKIIAQLENHQLKVAKKKDVEESQAIVIDDDANDGFENHRDNFPRDRFNRNRERDDRFRRGSNQQWRGRRGFNNGMRGPLPRAGVADPWAKQPHWGDAHYDGPDMLDARSNSPTAANELIINHNSSNIKKINVDGQPRDIVFYGEEAVAFMNWDDPREISFQNGSRKVVIDEVETFLLHFNDPYTEVTVYGYPHRLKLGAPTKEIFVDGKGYECCFGGPGIPIELNNKISILKVEGPIPQVKIGRKSDLVLGRINLIIDAKIVVPVFLDATIQRFEINDKPCTLRFSDSLQTVWFNDQRLVAEYGSMPKPVMIGQEKHFFKFSALPMHVKPGCVVIRNMDGCPAVETIPLDEPSLPRKKSRFGSSSPEPQQPNINDIQQVLQKPTMGNLDHLLSNVFAAQQTQQLVQNMSAYQVESNQGQLEHSNDGNVPPLAPPPALPPMLDINKLFQQLVEKGIVSTQPIQPAPVEPLPAVTLPTSQPTILPPVTVDSKQNTNGKNPSWVPPSTFTSTSSNSHSSKRNKKKEEKVNWKYVDLSRPATLKTHQPALLKSLYSGMQCSSCGMRFLPENSNLYSQHLDWHFRQNRKGKKNIRKASSRKWYYSMSDWMNYEEIEDLEEREKCFFDSQQKDGAEGVADETDEPIEIPSVIAEKGVSDPKCEVCQEAFEQFFNEDKEEWHLRMAIRVDGITYHPLCYEDYQASLAKEQEQDESVIEIDDSHSTTPSDRMIIPGLESAAEMVIDPTPEVIIDDEPESTAEQSSPDNKSLSTEEKTDAQKGDEAEEEDDDEVIINEVVPEQINLDEYEFKRPIDDDEVIAALTIKKEKDDDGFLDVDNIKVKTEPITPDESFEDVGQHVIDLNTNDAPTFPAPPPATELVATIDGNVAHVDTASSAASVGVNPLPPGAGKIRINISKPLPVIAPKENKDLSLDSNEAQNNNNSDPTVNPNQPLPPGEEPVQLIKKPALQGIELKKVPAVHKGSELTGLCSIM